MAKPSATATKAAKKKQPEQVKRQDIFVSVVVSTKTVSGDLGSYVRDLSATLIERYMNYEIIIVDNDYPLEYIAPVVRLLDEYPCLRVIRLSRTYKHDTAIMAGLEAAIGDYVVIVDPVVDPIENIPAIVEANKKHDIVQGVADTGSLQETDRNFGRKLFYWYNRRYLDIDVPVDATYFLSMNRRAVRAAVSAAQHDIHIRHVAKTIGYSYTTYVYETSKDPARHSSLRTGIFEAFSIIGSHSTHPLRVMAWVGLVASILNLIYAVYVVLTALLRGHVAEGWTTMSLQLSGMFFILFILLAVLSEYISKILSETRRDLRYLVMDELTSTVSFADMERKNISTD